MDKMECREFGIGKNISNKLIAEGYYGEG